MSCSFPPVYYYTYYDTLVNLMGVESFVSDGGRATVVSRSDSGDDIICYATFNVGLDGWYLHCEDGPAVIYGDRCIFYDNGRNITIGDLGCDNEVKCVLLLRYEERFHSHSFKWYT